MTTPGENKRTVRELNQLAVDDLATAKRLLYQMIGERDPVKVQRALREALPHLDGVSWSLNEIEQICALNAQRGPYKKRDE